MVISSSHNYSKDNFDVVKINTTNKIKVKNFSQNEHDKIFLKNAEKFYRI